MKSTIFTTLDLKIKIYIYITSTLVGDKKEIHRPQNVLHIFITIPKMYFKVK